MKVCFGGTFNILHKGHELLFDKAFEEDNQVFIGITSDGLARKAKTVDIEEYENRKKNLESFLDGKGLNGRYSITRLDDELGPAVRKDFDAIVVSEETKSRVEIINSERQKNGLKPLNIFIVKLALAENGEVISATKVAKHEMDVNGKMMRKVAVCVGSENQVKIEAVGNVFSTLFRGIQVTGRKVASGVPEQPKEREVIEGAVARAEAALMEDYDFGVGIEAGLFLNEVVNQYFDVQYCAVIDKGKRMTLGHGSGFCYPEEIMELIGQGKTVGQSFKEKYGISDVGRKMGAIGLLSKELLVRTKLTEQAVLMAMVPRIRRDLYEK